MQWMTPYSLTKMYLKSKWKSLTMSSVLKCTETVVGTFFTYSVFSFPESIDFLSCGIVSGWMSCNLTRGRDVKKNLFSAGVSNVLMQLATKLNTKKCCLSYLFLSSVVFLSTGYILWQLSE